LNSGQIVAIQFNIYSTVFFEHRINFSPKTGRYHPVGVIPRRRGSRKMTNKQYYVYILASKRNGTLYTGITSDLIKRIWQHKNGLVEGFSKRYATKTLVCFEQFNDVEEAILREKRIKKWNRQWKINLIEKKNPDWDDLYHKLV
jgi:putative endonuclease